MNCSNRIALSGLLAAAVLLIGSADVIAANAVASGDWSSAATWDGAGEPTTVPDNPAIINGGHTVTITQPGENTTFTDLGTIAGETGTLDITGGDLAVSGGGIPSIRVGQAAMSTGILNMSAGSVTITGVVGSGFANGDLMVGDVGAGTMTMSGGTMSANDEIIIGLADVSTGTINVSGGTLRTTGRSILVGFDGIGELNVSGTGSVIANFDLLLGLIEGSSGEFNLSGGTVEAGFLFSNAFTGGAGSTVTMTQTGGTFNTRIAYVMGQGRGTSSLDHSGGDINVLVGAGDMVVSDGNLNTSTYNISGTATVNLADAFIVGAFGGSNGIVNQSGGTINAGGGVFVGRDGAGTWTMNGGALNQNGVGGADNNLIIGRASTSSFNQSAGAVNVAANVHLGDFDNSHGTYEISGGTLSIAGNLNVGAALASNAPPMPMGTDGQALNADGTFIVSGSGGVIDVDGNLLANADDNSRFGGGGEHNDATLIFEILDASGISIIDVAGIADLTGADIDVDILGGSFGFGDTFDLITASNISEDFLQVSEDIGLIELSIVAGGNGEILRATVVPEPSSIALLGIMSLVYAFRRRRLPAAV